MSKWLNCSFFWANHSFALSHTKKQVICSNFLWLKSYFLVRILFCFKNERFAHSLFFNERCEQITLVAHQKWAMWADFSGHSPKMSNHERFAQVTHQNRAIMRESLRSLTKNEKMSELLIFLSENTHSLIFGQKTSDLLGNQLSEFPALSLTLLKDKDSRTHTIHVSFDYKLCLNNLLEDKDLST